MIKECKCGRKNFLIKEDQVICTWCGRLYGYLSESKALDILRDKLLKGELTINMAREQLGLEKLSNMDIKIK